MEILLTERGARENIFSESAEVFFLDEGRDRDWDGPVEVANGEGRGPALLLCEHASNHIPARYKGLGLGPDDRTSHAAWDPGARDLALKLSAALDSPLIAARVSRLVYDCNRPPEAESATPVQSETIEVPGNRDIGAIERAERVATIYEPFCAQVDAILAARRAVGLATALITVHSFTPVWYGEPRKVEIGILHDDDSRLADAMLAAAAAIAPRRVERNSPYGPADGVTHSLRLHGLGNGLANVMIEVRNDLLRTGEDRQKMSEELLTLLRPALAAVADEPAKAVG